jgi:hypothetical protein
MTLQNVENFTVFSGADLLEKIKTLRRSLSGLPFKLKGKVVCLSRHLVTPKPSRRRWKPQR